MGPSVGSPSGWRPAAPSSQLLFDLPSGSPTGNHRGPLKGVIGFLQRGYRDGIFLTREPNLWLNSGIWLKLCRDP